MKIVDQSRAQIEPIIDYALAHGAPIEVGLYFGDIQARDLLRSCLPDSAATVAVHLNHRRLSLLEIQRQEAALREQLSAAAELGATSVITHLGNYPMTARLSLRERLWDQLSADLSFAEALASDYGLRLHIENTFHDLAFYRELLDALRASRATPVNFCFDMGHAKVWSSESLREWLAFLLTQRQQGTALHLHLHANEGLIDQHQPFTLASDREGVIEDDFMQDLDWPSALRLIDRSFPDAAKIFEVPPEVAVDHYEQVLAAINRLPH
nr:TIM barrel protein [Thiorhodococcus mannitoliphagus]